MSDSVLKVESVKRRPPWVKTVEAINKHQSSTQPLIRKSEFKRLIKEISFNFSGDQTKKWSSEALQAIQHAAEEMLVGLFEDSGLCALHCKRQTLMVKDMQLARRIRGRFE